MCEDCGCGDTEMIPVEVQRRILSDNDRIARHNQEHFEEAGVLAVNLMGSPGSGKTAILEATARVTAGRLRLAAVSGDLATERDAERLGAAGIASRAITTGQACHLDASLLHEALHELDWRGSDVLFVENVGNLVCPAVYDLGEAVDVIALSVTEGEDKPLKYPTMFRKADLVLVTKSDLVPHLDVDLDALRDALGRVMPEPRLILTSAKTGEGLDEWIAWLESRRSAPQIPVSGHPHVHPHR